MGFDRRTRSLRARINADKLYIIKTVRILPKMLDYKYALHEESLYSNARSDAGERTPETARDSRHL